MLEGGTGRCETTVTPPGTAATLTHLPRILHVSMRPFTTPVLVALATLVTAATPTRAQQAIPQSGKDPMGGAAAQMPSRAVLLEDIERSRQNILKYVAIAPDSMLAYRIVPGVRTYAEQLEHAAGSTAMIAAMAFKAPRPALPTDTATYRRSKSALTAYVNASYDAFAALVRNATDAQLLGEAEFFGNRKTGWRWIATSLEHATWTLGQTVPYLRAHRVTPPQYLPF